MKELIVQKNEAGQRLDKLLQKYLNKADYSFIRKMLRKKNIVLNNKKAEGNEILKESDSVKIWFSEETLAKFAVHEEPKRSLDAGSLKVPGWYKDIRILYEDADICVINKPAGVLSQKSAPGDHSVVEWLLDHMLRSGEITPEQLKSFHPGICNRLDRNTSGLVVCGKSLAGLQFMNEKFRDHTLDKFYRCIVSGDLRKDGLLEGYLLKNEKTNTVKLYKEEVPGSVYIKTAYHPLKKGADATLVEVQLFTGKTHQIRSHLASIGHPIIGDRKYGDAEQNKKWKNLCGVNNQLLHAYRLEMHDAPERFAHLTDRVFIADLPKIYSLVEEKMTGH